MTINSFSHSVKDWEINRTRLKNYSEAIKAYKIALVRRPDDIDTHKIIAQLYELEDDSEAAIAQYAILLKHDPRSVDTYRNMKKLYLELGRFDEAVCLPSFVSASRK